MLEVPIFFRRLVILSVFLVGGWLYHAFQPATQSQRRVPKSFSYPEAQESIRIDAKINSRWLSGVVFDSTGAAMSKVLVERLRANWGERLDATFSDANGVFRLTNYAGRTHFLKLSKPGFKTLFVKVGLTKHGRRKLRVELRTAQ